MPDKDIDFALYNINGVNLLPGLDVFSNPFHCDAHSVADAFQYVCEQLVHSNEQLTEVHYHCFPIIHVSLILYSSCHCLLPTSTSVIAYYVMYIIM